MKKMSPALSKGCPILRVENLTKCFYGKSALDKADFEVPEASLTVLLGPAGAGKTTTLRLIAGLERPDEGRVILGGEDVTGWEPKDRDVAMIFDTLALYPNKTGFENIASPLRIRKLPKEVIEEKVTELAKTLQVSRLLHRLPKTMSGGERQRIALGRALIRSPRIFLLDEPLSSLDAMLRIELRSELKRLQRDLGRTFLLATPDFHEALAVADTVIMLRNGCVVQTAEPQALYNAPLDKEIASFVGSPRINLIEAEYIPDRNGGSISAAGAEIPSPPHFAKVFAGGTRAFILGVRPENFRFEDPSGGAVAGELIDIEPLGMKSAATIRNNAAELRIHVESRETRGLAIGQNVGLAPVEPSKMLAFDAETGKLMSP